MTPAPDVTVVIPTLGRWSFVRTAMRAVRLQEDVRVEVVVVADGPRAGEWVDVPELLADDVRVIASPDRLGVADARNRGLEAARGEWVAFLDDDDVWSPRKLADQIGGMRAEHTGFAYSSGVVVGLGMRVRWVENAPAPEELPSHLVDNNPIPACSSNLVVRTDLGRRIGFDPDLMHFADWDFAVRLIVAAAGTAVPAVHVGYVWHDENMHTSRLEGIEAEFLRFRAKHLAVGRRLGGPSQSRWIAGSHRESGRRVRAAGAYLRGALRYRSLPDFVRAGGVLLGERAMRAGSRHPQQAAGGEPEWLALYRA